MSCHKRTIISDSGFNNSLDGGDCLNGGHNADDLAAIRCYRTTTSK